MDLYQVLGVRRNAPLAEIRRAYQKRARQLHPDLNPGDPVAAQRFAQVSQAFGVLADPQRRAEYDRGETPPAAPAAGVADVGFEGFDFSAEVRVGGVAFREIFAGVLQGDREDGGPTRGEDLEQGARITFEECLVGTRRRVHLVRQDRCPQCHGEGEVDIAPVPCPACAGSGQVRAHRGRMIFSRRCADCNGAGVLRFRSCPRCAGEGRVMQSEWLDVVIPAGAEEGSRVGVPGHGNAGRRGGPPGDFLLSVHVEPHRFYRREGADLHCEVPLTITEAALGAHVEVPTPEGPVAIQVPAGTQAGQRFRLRKRGLPRREGKGRGDLYVQARVWVPDVQDDESRELLREFARRNPKDPRKGLHVPPAEQLKGP
jgi:molecular chaperone DnaJ